MNSSFCISANALIGRVDTLAAHYVG